MLDIGRDVQNNRNKIMILAIIVLLIYIFVNHKEKRFENIENTQNNKNIENTQNNKNIENIQNNKNIENTQNNKNIENTQNNENSNKIKREMYVPNCNFLNDSNICSKTTGCKVINDKCYYDWINLQKN